MALDVLQTSKLVGPEIDRHGSKVEEFDVEGILNFAECYRERRTRGSKRRWSSGKGFSDCFFRKA